MPEQNKYCEVTITPSVIHIDYNKCVSSETREKADYLAMAISEYQVYERATKDLPTMREEVMKLLSVARQRYESLIKTNRLNERTGEVLTINDSIGLEIANTITAAFYPKSL